MTNRAKIRRISYLALWLLLLIVVERFYDSSETSDSEAIRSILFGLVTLLALPGSIALIGAWIGVLALLQLLDESILGWLNTSVFASKEWFRLQVLLWWLLMFSISYWQWFVFFPMLLLRRRSGRGSTPPPEVTQS
jgi:hypothetical protein